MERGEHDEADRDDEQPVRRINLAEDVHPARQHVRDLNRVRQHAPDHAYRVESDEDEPEGHQHLAHRALALHVPEEHCVEHRADQRHPDRSEDERGPVGIEPAYGGQRQIRAHHVERPVREVDEVHHPEHHGQPDREQEQQHRELQAVQRLDDQESGFEQHGAGRAGWTRDPLPPRERAEPRTFEVRVCSRSARPARSGRCA